MHMKNQGSGGTVQFLSRKWTLDFRELTSILKWLCLVEH